MTAIADCRFPIADFHGPELVVCQWAIGGSIIYTRKSGEPGAV
jgi:hypothetical protein